MGGYVSSLPRLIGMLALLLTVQVASATSIQYELSSLGGSNYRYDYTVSNDGSPGGVSTIEWFAILFDPALYDESSFNIVTADPPASESGTR